METPAKKPFCIVPVPLFGKALYEKPSAELLRYMTQRALIMNELPDPCAFESDEDKENARNALSHIAYSLLIGVQIAYCEHRDSQKSNAQTSPEASIEDFIQDGVLMTLEKIANLAETHKLEMTSFTRRQLKQDQAKPPHFNKELLLALAPILLPTRTTSRTRYEENIHIIAAWIQESEERDHQEAKPIPAIIFSSDSSAHERD